MLKVDHKLVLIKVDSFSVYARIKFTYNVGAIKWIFIAIIIHKFIPITFSYSILELMTYPLTSLKILEKSFSGNKVGTMNLNLTQVEK